MDVALLVENYIELRKKLGSAVFDSRCLIFGAQTELLANNRPDILQFSSVDVWKTSWKDIEDLALVLKFWIFKNLKENSDFFHFFINLEKPRQFILFWNQKGSRDLSLKMLQIKFHS